MDRAKTARSTLDIVVYSDASGRDDRIGAAVVALNHNLEIAESQQVQVGPLVCLCGGAYRHLLRN